MEREERRGGEAEGRGGGVKEEQQGTAESLIVDVFCCQTIAGGDRFQHWSTSEIMTLLLRTKATRVLRVLRHICSGS